jgi:hypothetical protein
MTADDVIAEPLPDANDAVAGQRSFSRSGKRLGESGWSLTCFESCAFYIDKHGK